MKETIYRGDCLKKGGFDSLKEGLAKKRAWQKRGDGVFEGGLNNPMHTMLLYLHLYFRGM